MRTISIISLLILFSCKNSTELPASSAESPFPANAEIAGNPSENLQLSGKGTGYKKTIGDIAYDFQFFRAVDYLEKIGQKPDRKDLKALEKETVVLISFTGKNASDILEKSALTPDDSQMYLSGGITEDLTIQQKNTKIEITGCQLLASGSRNDRLGVIFFVNGLNIHRKFDALFFDQLFNGGLIRIPSLKYPSK